jgi:hypothetical protein
LKVTPVAVVTDAALIYPVVLEDLVAAAWHHVQRHATNPIEADHSQLKHRLTPMRALRTDQTAAVIISGHAFMQNLRRGHYELALDVPSPERVAAMFTETRPGGLTRGSENEPPRPTTRQRNGARHASGTCTPDKDDATTGEREDGLAASRSPEGDDGHRSGGATATMTRSPHPEPSRLPRPWAR